MITSPSLEGLSYELPSFAVRAPYQPYALVKHSCPLQSVIAIADARLWRLTSQPAMLLQYLAHNG